MLKGRLESSVSQGSLVLKDPFRELLRFCQIRSVSKIQMEKEVLRLKDFRFSYQIEEEIRMYLNIIRIIV